MTENIISKLKRWFDKAKTKTFWININKDYRRNVQRQRNFKRLVEDRVACPSCGQKKMLLNTYKNDVGKNEFEVYVSCGGCGLTLLLRHDGVMAEYALRKPKQTPKRTEKA